MWLCLSFYPQPPHVVCSSVFLELATPAMIEQNLKAEKASITKTSLEYNDADHGCQLWQEVCTSEGFTAATLYSIGPSMVFGLL